LNHRFPESPNDESPVFLVVLVLGFLGSIGIVAHGAGTSYARKQSEFLAIEGEDFVLAGSYDNRMIFAEYLPGSPGALTGKLKVLSADDVKDIDLVWKELGPIVSRRALHSSLKSR
jgi:hypothetical protein